MVHIFKVPDQDSHLYHQANYTWRGPPPHGATATELTDTTLWGLFLEALNIRNGQDSGSVQAIQAVKIGGFEIMILRNTNITNQSYFRKILGCNMVYLPMRTPAAGKAQRGGVTSHPVPTPVLELKVDMLLRSERGDLQGRHHQQRKTYPDHQLIPPALHLGSLTGLVGGPDTLPVPKFSNHRTREASRLLT